MARGGRPRALKCLTGGRAGLVDFLRYAEPGIDFLRGINALGIVVELPESMLLPPNAGSDPKLGIWATTSR